MQCNRWATELLALQNDLYSRWTWKNNLSVHLQRTDKQVQHDKSTNKTMLWQLMSRRIISAMMESRSNRSRISMCRVTGYGMENPYSQQNQSSRCSSGACRKKINTHANMPSTVDQDPGLAMTAVWISDVDAAQVRHEQA